MDKHSVEIHDRGAGFGSLVYPVMSRRAGGLSLGINLFPDAKRCSFDCPYCEVLPFRGEAVFSPGALAARLELFFGSEYGEEWAPEPLKDICVSGNGEPTLSPWLGEALSLCASARRDNARVASGSKLVIITNSTGFLDPGVSAVLKRYCENESLEIWAKLDAGRQELFGRMSGSAYSLDEIQEGIRRFAAESPVVIQTMLCSLGDIAPGPDEARVYAGRVGGMLEDGAKIKAIHLYTVARKPATGAAWPLPAEDILSFAGIVKEILGDSPPVECFDSRGRISAISP